MLAELGCIVAKELYAICCDPEKNQFGGVIAQGGKMGGQKADLVVMQGNLNVCHYTDNVLHPHIISYLNNQGPSTSYSQTCFCSHLL